MPVKSPFANFLHNSYTQKEGNQRQSAETDMVRRSETQSDIYNSVHKHPLVKLH